MVLPFLAAIAPFASIIGGAIGAVGSLMAPKPKTGIDLGQLRRDAEENGFNPLTILRSGAAASYGHVADTRFSNAMQTFGSGVAQWQYDPYGEAKSIAELNLAKAQIGHYAKLGAAPANLSLGGVPAASNGAAGAVVNMPLERIGVGGAQEAPGAISDVGWIRTATGWTVTPSKDAKERIEDDLIQQLGWAMRNQIVPTFGLLNRPFPDFLGPADPNKWEFHELGQEWRPRAPFKPVANRLPAFADDVFNFANPRFGQ